MKSLLKIRRHQPPHTRGDAPIARRMDNQLEDRLDLTNGFKHQSKPPESDLATGKRPGTR